MLAHSKYALFDETFTAKLDQPELGLEAWKGIIRGKKFDVRIEKIETGKTLMGGKKWGYKVTYTDEMYPHLTPSVRSKSDFYLLQTLLGSRFPDAVVPKVWKNEIENLHLIELFIKELASNPFFRLDVVFSDFMNPKMKEYKQTKKNEKKHSEGTLRWLQQITEFPEYETPKAKLENIKMDLDQLERTNKVLIEGFLANIKMLDHMQEAAGVITSSLSQYLAMEQTTENKTEGTICGLPPGRLRSDVKKLIELNQHYEKGLELVLDGRTFERLMIQPIFIEFKVVTSLKKLIDYTAAAKQDFNKAKKYYDSLPPDASNKASNKISLNQKEIYFFKARRSLGYEMEKYRTMRTAKFQKFFQSYVKFNLRFSAQLKLDWDVTGITLDQTEEQIFFEKEEFYKQTQGDPIVGVRKRGMSINASKKTKKKTIQGVVKVESLVVVFTFTPGSTSKYMKVTEGELLTGYQLPSGDWQVTSAKGAKGLVKEKCVKVKEREDAEEALNNINTLDILAQNDEEDDWSDENEHKILAFDSPQKSRPQAPAPPVMPATSPNTSPFGLVTAPKNTAYSSPEPQRVQLPAKKKNSISKPAPPVAEKKTAPSKPNAPAVPNKAVQKNTPRKVSLSKLGAPARPPMGGLLADITKVDKNRALKKVPDEAKSKEIGGVKDKGPAVLEENAGSSNAPAGGMAGELAQKLKNMKKG